MVTITKLQIFILFLCHQTITALIQPDKNTIVPTNYLQNIHSKNAPQLSSSKIIPMMPPSQSTKPLRQELFTSPLISTLYERILPPLWEAGLRLGGPDAEYISAVSYLTNNGEDDGLVALDLSCGTGFIARRMAQSPSFRYVFGLDYSYQMLQEAVVSLKRSRGDEELPLCWIRGDAGSLPFCDGVLDAVHWGAAMHCVPDVERALSEVYRVLKPGGRLYATTFLRPFPDVVFRFFTVEEMERLGGDAGFGDCGENSDSFLEVEGKGVYGILRATK